MDNRYEIAEQNGMSLEFADWFFDNKKDGCGNAWFVMMAAMWEGWKGRAEPPVPEIQVDVAQAIEKLKRKLVECNRYNYCADAVKGVEYACHAAMLQGSQPVSQTYKFPVNTPCQDAPAHIWLQTAGVWPEDGELSELTWCSHNQHHDDTLYVRADLVNGNSPVTPDGWVMVPKEPTQDMIKAWLSEIANFRGHAAGYRAALEAAPQLEVNRG
ncbi:hypothetical protein QWY39_008570 [Escherichia coli]|uniref:hypothetical protein n=1 Tax=Escherichia coli TaxID=562 RepID=UPI0025B45F68|nr:hypothetical protein [Escherichia coli]MDN3753963.1 hypothetical protein [Escherichia coli]